MIKDISKIMTWYIWKVTYRCRNVTIVCGASYHLLGSQISWDSKIWFWLQVKSHISDWRFSESQYLARYVSRHNAMAYDMLLTSFFAPFLVAWDSNFLSHFYTFRTSTTTSYMRPHISGTLYAFLWECLTAVCKALSLADAKGKGTDGLVIRS